MHIFTHNDHKSGRLIWVYEFWNDMNVIFFKLTNETVIQTHISNFAFEGTFEMLIYLSKQTIISISMIRMQKATKLFWSTEITQPNIELAQ